MSQTVADSINDYDSMDVKQINSNDGDDDKEKMIIDSNNNISNNDSNNLINLDNKNNSKHNYKNNYRSYRFNYNNNNRYQNKSLYSIPNLSPNMQQSSNYIHHPPFNNNVNNNNNNYRLRRPSQAIPFQYQGIEYQYPPYYTNSQYVPIYYSNNQYSYSYPYPYPYSYQYLYPYQYQYSYQYSNLNSNLNEIEDEFNNSIISSDNEESIFEDNKGELIEKKIIIEKEEDDNEEESNSYITLNLLNLITKHSNLENIKSIFYEIFEINDKDFKLPIKNIQIYKYHDQNLCWCSFQLIDKDKLDLLINKLNGFKFFESNLKCFVQPPATNSPLSSISSINLNYKTNNNKPLGNNYNSIVYPNLNDNNNNDNNNELIDDNELSTEELKIFNKFRHVSKTRLFIGNIPFNLTNYSLWLFLTNGGENENIKLIKELKLKIDSNGLSRGFAICLTNNEESSIKLIENFNNKLLNNRKLIVRFDKHNDLIFKSHMKRRFENFNKN